MSCETIGHYADHAKLYLRTYIRVSVSTFWAFFESTFMILDRGDFTPQVHDDMFLIQMKYI